MCYKDVVLYLLRMHKFVNAFECVCMVLVSGLNFYLAPHADKMRVAAIGTMAQSGAEKLNSWILTLQANFPNT